MDLVVNEGVVVRRVLCNLYSCVEILAFSLYFRGKVEFKRFVYLFFNELEIGFVFKNILIKLINKYFIGYRL